MNKKKNRSGWQKAIRIFLIVVAVLLVIRLILPFAVLRFANNKLADMPGYYGHIDDIDMAIIRGAYQIDSVYLDKVDSVTQERTPLFSASHIDLAIEWKPLFKGKLVGKVTIDDPAITFTKEKAEPEQLQQDSTSFKDVADGLMPLNINRLQINNGSVHYIDSLSKPPVNIRMTDIHVTALNLQNSYDSAALLPARIRADAQVYKGQLSIDVKLNPLASEPTFDLNAELKDTDLTELNKFFEAYAKIDVNDGTFGLYTEVAAKQGKFDGYVKPIIKNLDILGKDDRDDNIFKKMWEGVAGAVTELLENQPRDQFATKIPIQGSFEQANTNISFAVLSILRNAFIQALQPSIDYQINSTLSQLST